MNSGDGGGTAYWKARAEALEAANRRLHERLTALAAILPPEYLDVVEGLAAPTEVREAIRPAREIDAKGSVPDPADVERDLRSLWARTAPPTRD